MLASLVYWCGSLVVWCGLLVYWCGSLVDWCGSLVYRWGPLVDWCASLVYCRGPLVYWWGPLVDWCLMTACSPGSGAEVGTIGGIVSVVAMALVGAVTSYISYQKKKLCFGIQREEPPGLKLSLTLSQNVIRGALSD